MKITKKVIKWPRIDKGSYETTKETKSLFFEPTIKSQGEI
jgi:hypothetical protein